MIPILYKKDETNFSSHGLGDLVDCISAHVVEERNGQFTMDFVYPVGGVKFELIEEDCIVKAKPNDTMPDQLFRIFQSSKPINGQVTFNCNHISYDLAFNPVPSITLNGTPGNALNQLLEGALNPHPYTAFSDKTNVKTTTIGPLDVRSILAGNTGSVLDIWGGEYKFDNYVINLLDQRGIDTGVLIQYGKNLTDFNQQTELDKVYTSVYPYATIQDSNGNSQTITLPEKILHLSTEPNYPIKRTMMLDLSNDNTITDVDTLRSAAQKYATDNQIDKPSISWTIVFQELSKTEDYKNIAVLERCSLCDYVMVRVSQYDVDVKSEIVATDYDVLSELYISMTLGDPISDFATTYNSNSSVVQQQFDHQQNFFQQAVSKATEAITGTSGGYVRLNPATHPQEILIMDTDDINTATKVWRWNVGGLGYSNNGYNGPFELAMTMDGSIVADFITTGVLKAIEIQGVNISGSSYYMANGSMSIWLDSNGFHMFNNSTNMDVYIDGNGIRALKNGNPVFSVDNQGNLNVYGGTINGAALYVTSDQTQMDGSTYSVRLGINPNWQHQLHIEPINQQTGNRHYNYQGNDHIFLGAWDGSDPSTYDNRAAMWTDGGKTQIDCGVMHFKSNGSAIRNDGYGSLEGVTGATMAGADLNTYKFFDIGCGSGGEGGLRVVTSATYGNSGPTYADIYYQTAHAASLAEFKQDIAKMTDSALDLVNALPIYRFHYKTDVEGSRAKWMYGPVIGNGYDPAPDDFLDYQKQGTDDHSAVYILAKAVQELSVKVDAQQQTINDLGTRLAALEAKNSG